MVRRGSFAASISRKGLCVAGPSSQRRVACNRAHGNAAYGRTGSQRLLPTRALTSASLSRPTCDRERRSRRSTAWRAQPLNRPRLRIAPLLGSVAATRAAYYRAQASKLQGLLPSWGGAHSTISTDTRTTSVASPAYFKCEYGLSRLNLSMLQSQYGPPARTSSSSTGLRPVPPVRTGSGSHQVQSVITT